MRLKMAEETMATRGGSARVPTAVAMAFAVSWKLLVKSKARAMAMVRTRRSNGASGMLDRNALEHVRHVLAAIECILQEAVQVLQLDDIQRRGTSAEELGDSAARGRVADVLEPVDLDEMLATPLTRLELANRLLKL